jgi:hypothetical protein
MLRACWGSQPRSGRSRSRLFRFTLQFRRPQQQGPRRVAAPRRAGSLKRGVPAAHARSSRNTALAAAKHRPYRVCPPNRPPTQPHWMHRDHRSPPRRRTPPPTQDATRKTGTTPRRPDLTTISRITVAQRLYRIVQQQGARRMLEHQHLLVIGAGPRRHRRLEVSIQPPPTSRRSATSRQRTTRPLAAT